MKALHYYDRVHCALVTSVTVNDSTCCYELTVGFLAFLMPRVGEKSGTCVETGEESIDCLQFELVWSPGLVVTGRAGPGLKYGGPGRAFTCDGPGLVFDGPKRAFK